MMSYLGTIQPYSINAVHDFQFVSLVRRSKEQGVRSKD